jgi:hypothetical protein
MYLQGVNNVSKRRFIVDWVVFFILLSYYFYVSYLIREEKKKLSDDWDGSDIHPIYKIKK